MAIAKDRAIESLMQVGDRFVLNCLPEEGFEPIMKHFLIRFPPGADRFEGVEWAPASCGARHPEGGRGVHGVHGGVAHGGGGPLDRLLRGARREGEPG